MEVSSNGGNPSHHPFIVGNFPQQKPSSYLGIPQLWKPTYPNIYGDTTFIAPPILRSFAGYTSQHYPLSNVENQL